jgi:hypothetical protein
MGLVYGKRWEKYILNLTNRIDFFEISMIENQQILEVKKTFLVYLF